MRPNEVVRPDIVTLGPATRLVSVRALAHELRVPSPVALDFLLGMYLRTVSIGGVEYFHMAALELALWTYCQPFCRRKRGFKELYYMGRIYSRLTREQTRDRLRDVLEPLTEWRASKRVRRRKTRSGITD